MVHKFSFFPPNLILFDSSGARLVVTLRMGECTDSEMDQFRTASAPLLANEDALDDLHNPKTNPRKRKGAATNVPFWKEGSVPIGERIGFYQPVNFIHRRTSDFPITAPSLYQYLNDGKPF